MPNTVRVINGSTIQVRTGVIQGIGPEGPKGQQGVPGPRGAQGSVGETGAQGAITQQQARSNISTTQPLTASTDTTLTFATNIYDQFSCFSGATATLKDIGDYLFSVWVGFNKPTGTGAGGRSLWLNSVTSGLIARTSVTALGTETTYLTLVYPYRTTVSNEVINVIARTGEASAVVNITQGAWTITRVGSGPKGDQGVVGPQGPPGATGAVGAQGPQGNAGSGFLTYNALKQP